MDGQILTPWLYRRWSFSGPAELYPAVLSRLRGSPARADELASSMAQAQLRWTPESGWSVQRHIAHMADLETLLTQRLDAYEAGVHLLPAADMSNARTVEADHDDALIADVLARFRDVRAKSMARLAVYPPDFFARSAWHERLGVQKRAVDTCQFFADHDDHHLALAHAVSAMATGTEPRP